MIKYNNFQLDKCISSNTIIKLILTIYVGINISTLCLSQTLRFDKNAINFGDRVQLIYQGKDSIEINLDDFINLDYGLDSNMIDSIADVVIPNSDERRSYSLHKGDTLSMDVYSPGRLYLPSIGDSLIIFVNPLQQVNDYADIKNIEVVEVSIIESWLKWFMLILVGSTLFYVLYKYWQKRKKSLPLNPEIVEVILPYQVVALNALTQLRDDKKYEESDTKSFQIAFTNILKEYLGKDHHLQSMEMTTDELLAKLKSSATQQEISKYREFLSIADLVKFAKAKPGSEIQLEMLDEAIEMITAKYSPKV